MTWRCAARYKAWWFDWCVFVKDAKDRVSWARRHADDGDVEMGIIDRVTMSVRGFCTQCGKIFSQPGDGCFISPVYFSRCEGGIWRTEKLRRFRKVSSKVCVVVACVVKEVTGKDTYLSPGGRNHIHPGERHHIHPGGDSYPSPGGDSYSSPGVLVMDAYCTY